MEVLQLVGISDGITINVKELINSDTAESALKEFKNQLKTFYRQNIAEYKIKMALSVEEDASKSDQSIMEFLQDNVIGWQGQKLVLDEAGEPALS